MGRAIVGGVILVVVLLIVAGVYIWTRRHDDGVKGDLSTGQEQKMRELVNDAAMIFTELGPKSGIDDSDFLSEYSKNRIRTWVDTFNKTRKEFDRA